MKHKISTQFLAAISLGMALVFSATSFASIQTYDERKTKKLLRALTNYSDDTKTVVQGEYKSEEARRFMDYYLNVMAPEYEKMSTLVLKYKAYKLLMDTGSQRNNRELKRWKKQLAEVLSQLNEYDVNEEWTAKLKEFSDLAGNLEGDIPDSARRAHREREKEVFPKEMKPLLDELSTLNNEYELAVNNAPSKEGLGLLQRETLRAVLGFREGQVSLEEAMKILEEVHSKHGSRNVGYDAVKTDPNRLNRMAVIRSQLAKAKGHTTWADYALHDDEGYSEAYRGVDQQREFTKKLIRELAPVLKEATDKRLVALGLDPETVKDEFISLALPKHLTSLNAYFPASDITRIWIETMKESGFDDKALSQILVDDQPRKGKLGTGAYMMPVYGRWLEENVIDAATLTPVTPDKNSDLWQDALTYILQNYRVGGAGDAKTMWHEGGHALEKAYKGKNKSNPEAYAYVETPSMTMEYYMKDPEILWNKMVPVNGYKPTLEEVQELAKGGAFAVAYRVVDLASSALFDINLWDYDYDQPGAKTFLQRVEELYEENQKLTLSRPGVETTVPNFYAMVASPHFYSGSVRYMGYVYADMSSAMMKDFIYDEIEKSSGRRSWYNQPGLKEIFADRFFSEGWKTSFPENIEGITGRKFDPEIIIADLLKDLNDCAAYLKK